MRFAFNCRSAAGALFLLLSLGLQACEEFEYSPYEVRLDDDEKDINTRNIARIEALDIAPGDTLRFILSADVQGFYEENEAMVHNINQRHDIDFLLLGGDLTDFGLAQEFKLIHEDFKTLQIPYVAVIGNHDAVNNGQLAFKAMYGDYNTSFAVGNSKFILLNTNYIEFDKQAPDLDWLEKELAASAGYENIFVVSHIPPENYEFGQENAARYGQLLSQYNVTFSLHGHNHTFKYSFPFDGTVPYVQTTTSKDREYLVFTVMGDDVSFERVHF
ncbi:metallophosphoesterase [Pontibacter sp. 172403-2]|uniref:metallophosphoesterase family protein n=1 Tax=Pontibacter rufus TaxID=2791028 RepID=UPI0018AFDA32|nr:metallophosphoesterase [Pontibacter sp. 172403-2]MBF9254198.1 metallophosphoesterase [Pontibacter sp. 172403-2]